MKKMSSQKGQLLVEAIVAMAVVAIIITGIVVALTYSVNNSNLSKDQNKATNLAQEGLDIIRDWKDTDFTTLSNYRAGTYCLAGGSIPETIGADGCESIGGKFVREVYINPQGQDARKSPATSICTNNSSNKAVFVASFVMWSDNRCAAGSTCHSAELQSCFSDPLKITYPQ